MEQGSFPVWKGLFDWSLKFQDGTKPSNFKPEEFTPERRAWLEEALKHYMANFADRMKEIKELLEKSQPAAAADSMQHGAKARDQDQADTEEGEEERMLEEKEALLDELMDIVASIDYARDLHKIGGLPTLLELMACRYPSLRWRATEVAATCMANNPPVQQWFLEGGILARVCAVLEDQNATCRTKGLLAVSALVRHFTPGFRAFQGQRGTQRVVELCKDEHEKVQRKAFSLLQYMVERDRSAVCSEACSLGLLPALQTLLAAPTQEEVEQRAAGSGAGDGADVEAGTSSDAREAALSLLLEVTRTPEAWSQVKQMSGLPAVLHTLRQRHAKLSQEEREAQQEEEHLAGQIVALLQRDTAPDAPPAPLVDDHVEESEEGGRGQAPTKTISVNHQQPEQQQQQRAMLGAMVAVPGGNDKF
mmetsp:Transcript_20175/g.43960  ORF Transcript_20175/g.43960 Transcript_20175/m.43960 type:complete len:420 (-) Transcript_20175:533-1792(-)|eukprot:CAMPEP_0202907554 /NCGR_PEP_ID=MMETSP1392-20130828/43043_1 /ASSEMBLY_ACC=CAM_ASM_000868 /TAXON_ID=225041 /ORGANISM="Chlamydomonas chlamydogama, Strain SAG 11-48b" /LENGTH=419 /DNA_ID=CAMNT_0049596513 /DNA_START=45 /DNA_END=1307 /DNA_ORIENTATION=+